MLEQQMFEGIYDDTPKRKKKRKNKESGNSESPGIKRENINSIRREVRDKKITNSVSGKKKRTVTICSDCCYLKDNKLGLYCCWGTRKIGKIKRAENIKVVCLDCDEPGKQTEEIADSVYQRIKERKRNG